MNINKNCRTTEDYCLMIKDFQSLLDNHVLYIIIFVRDTFLIVNKIFYMQKIYSIMRQECLKVLVKASFP